MWNEKDELKKAGMPEFKNPPPPPKQPNVDEVENEVWKQMNLLTPLDFNEVILRVTQKYADFLLANYQGASKQKDTAAMRLQQLASNNPMAAEAIKKTESQL